jgi:hypothetical protein
LRIAMVVYPSYRPRGVHEAAMQSAALLPGSFTRLPVQEHFSQLRDMLDESGFFASFLGELVSKNDLKSAITAALQGRPEVMMLVFCGHGAMPKQPQQRMQHGIMRLSNGATVTSAELCKWTEDAGFGGTLIQLLNMCHAAHEQPLPTEVVPAYAGGWASAGQPMLPLDAEPPAYRSVTFYSCESGDTQTPEHASDVLSAFVGAVGKKYAQLRVSWPEGGWHGSPQPFCHMASDYSGVFPGPAGA